MARGSIICRKQGLRQIIDLREPDKSRYFAIPVTKFNNCFISYWSLSLFSYLNHSPGPLWKRCAIFHTSVVSIVHEQIEYNLQVPVNTFQHLDSIVHDYYLRVVICWSCGGLSANQKEGKNASNDNININYWYLFGVQWRWLTILEQNYAICSYVLKVSIVLTIFFFSDIGIPIAY